MMDFNQLRSVQVDGGCYRLTYYFIKKMENWRVVFKFGSVGLYYQSIFGTSCGSMEKGVF